MSWRTAVVLVGSVAVTLAVLAGGIWYAALQRVAVPGHAPSPKIPANPSAETAPVDTGSRHEFAHKLSQVKEGMPEAEVLALLGKPDDIRTHTDAGGISTTRTREIWRYGTNGHLTFATLGCVSIDTEGKVQYVYGGHAEPPPPELFPEEQLRSLLRLIDTAPSYNTGSHYNPRLVIQIVNALQPLGKQKALAAIGEYLRVASDFFDHGRAGVFLVLRVLFDVPADPGHMPRMVVGAPWPAGPKDPKRLPRFPVLLVDDVPLLLVSGYMLGGKAEEPERHLDYFKAHGQLRSKPLTPGNDPLALMAAVEKEAGWLFGLDLEPGRHLVGNQLLALMETVYRSERDSFGYRFSPDGDATAAWKAIAAEVGKLKIRWNSAECRYTFADGSRLPDPVRKEYRRHIWTVDGLNGEAELILERQDEKLVRVFLEWSGKNGQQMPAFDLTVSEVGEKNPLNRFGNSSVSGSGGSESFSSQSFQLTVREGTKLQARLVVGGREQQSPVFVP